MLATIQASGLDLTASAVNFHLQGHAIALLSGRVKSSITSHTLWGCNPKRTPVNPSQEVCDAAMN